MDEKTVENLQFHQDTVASDANSPLHLIREKEIEISGRMLAAKRQADEIVADARKQAVGLMGSAHDEGSVLAKKQEEEIASRFSARSRSWAPRLNKKRSPSKRRSLSVRRRRPLSSSIPS